MGDCCSSIAERHIRITGVAHAGMDVDDVAGYLRNPRNWIPHLVDGAGGKDVVCAPQGPGTDAVSFTFQPWPTHHYRSTAHTTGSTHQTASGTAQVKRVDVQGDRAVVEVFTNFSTNSSSLYTFTLQPVSNTVSSQSGTIISTTVATTYEMPAFAMINMELEARKQLQMETDALMTRLAAVLSFPVVEGKPVEAKEATGIQVPPMGKAM